MVFIMTTRDSYQILFAISACALVVSSLCIVAMTPRNWCAAVKVPRVEPSNP